MNRKTLKLLILTVLVLMITLWLSSGAALANMVWSG